MRHNLLAGLSIAALCAATSPASAQTTTLGDLASKGFKPMPAAELEQLIVGNTLYHESAKNQTQVVMFYRADGMRVFNWIRGRFEGPYRIQDNMRCESSVQGGTVCFHLVKTDDRIWVCDSANGACEVYIHKVVRGNPENIS